MLKIPIIRTLTMNVIFSLFARNLAITTSAGIPLNEAIEMIAALVENHIFTNEFRKLKIAITQGQQLHSAMQKQSRFPQVFVQMIKVGEESGTLQLMLEKTADLYEKQINQTILTLGQLLEPLIMLVLGVLIGGLVIAMYLPIFQLGKMI